MSNNTVFTVKYNPSEFSCDDDGSKFFELNICVKSSQFTFRLSNELVYREYMPKTLFEDFAKGKNVKFIEQKFYSQDFHDVSITCQDGIVVISKEQDFSGGRIDCEIPHDNIKEGIEKALEELIDANFFG